jgi:hypothetical protein
MRFSVPGEVVGGHGSSTSGFRDEWMRRRGAAGPSPDDREVLFYVSAWADRSAKPFFSRDGD